MTPVFVYGTLKKGFSNHRLLEASEFLGKATTVGEYRMVDAGFPALLTGRSENTGRVSGEVYLVTDETLASLDRLEGAPNMYQRVRGVVLIEGIGLRHVQYYLGNPKMFGDYEDFLPKENILTYGTI